MHPKIQNAPNCTLKLKKSWQWQK